jgi:hypothetical protein
LLGRQIHSSDGFVEPLKPARIAPRNDHEILVGPVALAAAEPDLVGEFLSRDHMGYVFVIVRPLREQLVRDMDTGHARTEELAHDAHRVQWLAEPSAGSARTGMPTFFATCLLDQPSTPRVVGYREVDERLLDKQPAQCSGLPAMIS